MDRRVGLVVLPAVPRPLEAIVSHETPRVVSPGRAVCLLFDERSQLKAGLVYSGLGTGVADETPLVELLRDLHGSIGGHAEVSRSFLLQLYRIQRTRPGLDGWTGGAIDHLTTPAVQTHLIKDYAGKSVEKSNSLPI